MIPNTDITPAKAKILLQLCLAQDLDPEHSAQIFASY
jgi:L-asparaginase/Glu-tRNA(Gln) amidotransferase subunit D